MKTVMVNGVECVRAEWRFPLVETVSAITGKETDDPCTLCPILPRAMHKGGSGCGAPCGAFYYVPAKYIPILQMRGVLCEDDNGRAC